MIAAKLILFFVIILGLVIISGLWYYCGYCDAIDDALKAIGEVFDEKKELEKEHTEEQKKY